MELDNPVVVYTAANNLEAHLIVEMLHANGVPAHVVEDQSVVGQWMFGMISQIHKPNVWVNEAAVKRAVALIEDFEEKQRARSAPDEGPALLDVVCDECGKTSSFPKSLDGTTQDCPHCHAYVDVGDLPWDVDFGEPVD